MSANENIGTHLISLDSRKNSPRSRAVEGGNVLRRGSGSQVYVMAVRLLDTLCTLVMYPFTQHRPRSPDCTVAASRVELFFSDSLPLHICGRDRNPFGQNGGQTDIQRLRKSSMVENGVPMTDNDIEHREPFLNETGGYRFGVENKDRTGWISDALRWLMLLFALNDLVWLFTLLATGRRPCSGTRNSKPLHSSTQSILGMRGTP